MDVLVIPGVVVTLIGIGGLAYCIVQANKTRTSGLEGEELVAQLQKLIPINLASVCIAAMGLAAVTIGLLL